MLAYEVKKIIIPNIFLYGFEGGGTYKINVSGLVCCSWQPPIYVMWRIFGAHMLNCCLRDKSSAKDDKIYVYDRNITRQSLSTFSKWVYLIWSSEFLNFWISELNWTELQQLSYWLVNSLLVNKAEHQSPHFP